MQCKDIPDRPVLEFLRDLPFTNYLGEPTTYKRTGCPWVEFDNGVPHAMPPGVPDKLVRAKMEMLIRRGLVDGCSCGCRGDFELTSKGEEFLAKDKS